MAEDKKEESAIDSWEDLLGEDQEDAFKKLNDALEKVQLSDGKKEVDPFGPSISKGKKVPSNDNQFDGFRHLVVLSGSPMNCPDVLDKMRKYFGTNVRLKEIDNSTALIIFSNVMDARHALRNQSFSPLRLLSIDDPDFRHSDFLFEHRDELRPSKNDIRPATNMSVVRNTISRHLNVKISTPSKQQQEEKEQLKRAREVKKAKEEMWK